LNGKTAYFISRWANHIAAFPAVMKFVFIYKTVCYYYTARQLTIDPVTNYLFRETLINSEFPAAQGNAAIINADNALIM